MGIWQRLLSTFKGTASRLLTNLVGRAGTERDRWASEYQAISQQAEALNRSIELQVANNQEAVTYARASQLHRESIQVADSAHAAFRNAHAALDALSEAIVETAKQRKRLEDLKRRTASTLERQALQAEIEDMHRLRDEILIPDKDRVKAQKNHLLAEVRRLNMRTAGLRDIRRQRLAIEAPPTRATVKWYSPEKGYGFVTTSMGDAYLSSKVLGPVTVAPGSILMCRLVTQNGRLRVEALVAEH